MAELLVVPLKKSSDVDIVKPLKNLIQSTYNSGENNEDYSEAINELSRLRTNAIWKVFEKSSLDIIYSYYDQLVALETKIPPQEVQIPFKWKDAFDKGSIFGGRMSLTISSLAYERMCVLFNIAALQSALAAQQPLDTEDSLKLAAKLLQQAAGIFSYLKGNIMMAVHQETTPDLNPETLETLSKLMLAQAQEVIAYKCIRDEMKESMVAKVCAQVEELYTDALRSLQKESMKHLWDREWIPAVQSKQTAFRGLTQYYQSLVCKSNKLVGEEIARLQWAVDLLKPSAGTGGLRSEIATKASRALAAAVRDNDFIYHERIPERTQLEPVPRAAIAKALTLPDNFGSGKDLFASLVPLGVRAALSASSARRQEMVSAEINKLRDATQLLNSILASLNLPACIEEECSGASLPESILAKAAAVRAAGGAAELARLMRDLPDLLQRNRDILDEAERMLREEEEADKSLRQQFGARWSRTESSKLTESFRANADKYRQIIDNAVRADNIVRDKYNQHKESIELLSGSEGELCAGVPAAPDAAPTGRDAGAARAQLRQLMQEVEAMKAERDGIEAELKSATVDMRQQFLQALHESGAIDEPALSAAALGAALRPLIERGQATIQKQEALAEKIQRAHAQLASPGSSRAPRDDALKRLAAAHDAYQELTANLTEGVKFYNDLTHLLLAYQNKVADFCFARKTEKEELMKDLTQEASRPPRPAPAPPAYNTPAEEPAVQKKEAPPRPPPPSTTPSSAPSQQPQMQPSALPYPSQPQGMPLPYGAPAYQQFAPMPPLYNPYATLPYPHHAPRMPPPQQYQPYQYPPPPAGYPQPPPHGYNPYPQQ